jgi:hypothetical protein
VVKVYVAVGELPPPRRSSAQIYGRIQKFTDHAINSKKGRRECWCWTTLVTAHAMDLPHQYRKRMSGHIENYREQRVVLHASRLATMDG